MPRRPSYTSIRARQRAILEYQLSTDRYGKKAARDFGVTPRQLEAFTSADPKKLRRAYNQSPGIRQLFHAGAEKNLRAEARQHDKTFKQRPLVQYSQRVLQPLRKTPNIDQQVVSKEVQTGERIQYLYTQRVTPQFLWAEYTRKHDLPISAKTIKVLFRNGYIDPDLYDEVTAVWEDIYPKGDASVTWG